MSGLHQPQRPLTLGVGSIRLLCVFAHFWLSCRDENVPWCWEHCGTHQLFGVSRYSVENLSEHFEAFYSLLAPQVRSACGPVCVFARSLSPLNQNRSSQRLCNLRVICLNKRMWRINHNNAALLSRRLSFFFFCWGGSFWGFLPSICLPAKNYCCFFSAFPPLTHLWEECARSSIVNNAALWRHTSGIMIVTVGSQYTPSCSWLLFSSFV